ncbi:MAG: hypothetical protein ACOZQL_16515 [Myxococcota bacterium]
MKTRILWAALLLGLAGCPAATTGNDGGTGSGGGGGGSTGGGTGGGGGAVTVDGGVAYAPEWVSLEARVAGRTGRDLRLAIKAKDRNKDSVQVHVRLLDSVGGPVVGLDLNRDGIAETSEGLLLLEGSKWTLETVQATATARGVFKDGLAVAQVGVKVIDAASLESEEQVVAVLEQSVLTLGSPCDPLYVESRCEPGFGCRGTPAVCSEGLAPTISRLAFYKGTNGPTILIEGTEPEDDLATMRFQFQNAQGQPISIDSDGDGQPDLASFDQDALGLAVDGAYFIRILAGVGLDDQVPKLVVTGLDVAGHVGTPKTAAPTTIPVKNAGQTCDPRGFDVCAAGLTCSPGIVGLTTNKCASAAPLRTSQCNAAPVLVATAGGAVITGVAEGGSLWDAPAGCSSADPRGRPEGIVKVRLTDRASKLTLSTIGPATSFDTTIYVLPDCPNDVSDALGCNDDQPGAGSASQLELTDVPAGDYLVVIDSFDPNGGTFELHATVE